jgi:hypothetical protein
VVRYACVTASIGSAALYRGGLAAGSFAELALVAGVALYPGGFSDRLLSSPSLVALGRRSYSLYLWHYPIYVLVSPTWTSLTGGSLLVWRIGLTALMTELSYRMIERPVRRSRTTGIRLVIATLIPALVIFRLSFVALPASATPANVVPSAFGGQVPAAAASLRLMVAGDSWGLRTAYGLTVMAPPRPSVVFDDAQPSCGIADPVSETGYAGRFSPTAQCLAWRETWAATLTREHPDAVIFNIGNWDQASQQLVAEGPFVQPCDPSFQARYTGRLRTALTVLTSRGTPVFMTNVRDNDGAARATSDCMNALLTRAAAEFAHRGVYLLDLRQRLCGSRHICPHELHGQRVYDETGHLYVTTQVDVNAWELRAILSHVEPAQRSLDPHQTAVPQVPTDALALDGSLQAAVPQTSPSFPAGTHAATESDKAAASGLPAVLRSEASVVATAAPAARIRIADARDRTLGRVYAFQFATYAPAAAVASAVQEFALARGPRSHVITYNQKSFTVRDSAGEETFGLLRKPNLVVIVDLTASSSRQQVLVDGYLAALLPHI